MSESVVIERGPLRWVSREYVSTHAIVPPIRQSESKSNTIQDVVIPAVDDCEDSFDILPHQLSTQELLGTGEIGQVHKGQLLLGVS